MIIETLIGTVGVLGMACGIGALVFWKKNGNGHAPAPEPQLVGEWPLSKMREVLQPITLLSQQLSGLVERLDHPLVEASAQPAWPEIVGELERITKRVLVASRETKPEWASRIESNLAENDKRLERIASNLSENMADGMARFYSQVSKDLAAAVDLPALAEISNKLDLIVDNIPEADPQPELTAELTRQLADLPARIGQGVLDALALERKKKPPPPEKGKGGDPPPPRSAPPRNVPLMNPNELPATPSIPASYVPGTVDVPAGQVWSLLLLIQKQLSPNCPGTSAEFALSATNGTIFVGGASPLGGPLSETNYAYKLEDGDPPWRYRSTFPGNNTPVGEIQVLAPGGGSLHVEVQS